jgi:hypothetical protein
VKSNTIVALLLVTMATTAFGSASNADVPAKAIMCAAHLLGPAAKQHGLDLAEAAARDEWMRVESLHFESLPLNVFRAHLFVRRPGYIAIFAVDEQCTLIKGNLNDLLGLDISFGAALDFSVGQYNKAIGSRGDVDIKGSAPDVLARSILSLVSPVPSVVLTSSDDIPRNHAGRRGDMRMDRRKRSLVRQPTVVRGAGDIQAVRLFSWDEVGGVVWQNDFIILQDASIALSRTVLASKVGAFKTFMPEM